eukprot:c12925_g3_i1.p1 GENE.c12925_g3_i1~~c12925_g3_i1.p1  ORF type:complete len:716 (-),score=222.89 c12925_g3_i1:24-2138(-)
MLRGVASARSFTRVSPLALHCQRQFTVEAYAGKKTFDKILIANRGEIAVRIMKTARKMGIKTVAVYSDADANSNFVHYADEAVNIGPAPSAKSYLVVDRIMDAVLKTGAQAVHPGYGFLSENSAFCNALEQHGVVFIGPKYKSIAAMGDKVQSKIFARQAKVNTIPGFAGILETAEEAVRVSNEIGYPVMVKASGGGGGKAMRISFTDDEVREAFRLCKQEALSSFGDDRMFVEKFVEEPRHIEIQVLLDSFGNGVYLNERECSIQRRNQKVLEETPSVIVDPAMRKAMGEQALMMARAVDYQSAGTVEFLVDKNKNFYFLEMNTRLQVEHPITEMVTRQDIVAHMIGVAAGHKLPITQADVGIHGHAIEARVYAEDPFRNFLPSIGRLRRYIEPPAPIRVDTGVREGSEISMYYDPMISKTVAWAPTRAEALQGMRDALDMYVIHGVNHNVSLLRALLDHERFIDGRKITTKFIAEEYPKGFDGGPFTPADAKELAAVATLVHMGFFERSFFASGKAAPDLPGLHFECGEHKFWVKSSGKALSTNDAITVDIFSDETEKAESKVSLSITSDWHPGDHIVTVDFGRGKQHFQINKKSADGYTIQQKGQLRQLKLLTTNERDLWKLMPTTVKKDTSKLVLSPMPGQIKSLAVSVGVKVIVGQELLVMEAMKMQNIIRSPVDGVIKAINCKVGSNVQVDDELVLFE